MVQKEQTFPNYCPSNISLSFLPLSAPEETYTLSFKLDAYQWHSVNHTAILFGTLDVCYDETSIRPCRILIWFMHKYIDNITKL